MSNIECTLTYCILYSWCHQVMTVLIHFHIQYNTSPVSTVCVIGVYTRFQYNILSLKVMTVLLTHFHIQYNTNNASTVCAITVYTRFQYNILSQEVMVIVSSLFAIIQICCTLINCLIAVSIMCVKRWVHFHSPPDTCSHTIYYQSC